MVDVQVIMGSISDREIGDKITKTLEKLGIKYGITVASAHRTPERVVKIVKESRAKVFIAVAGLAAHLPGVVAAHTNKPVIGVPVNAALDGLDSLLSIVQMPPGVPVACVGVGRGENAALLAAQIIALHDKVVAKKLADYRDAMKKNVEKDAEKLEIKG